MKRTREEQLKSLSAVINYLQDNYWTLNVGYDDIMNLVALCNDLHKERLK